MRHPGFTPPEPRIGDPVMPAQFPGAGFHVGDDLDYEAMNAYAELVGWECRFYHPLRVTWPGFADYDELFT